MGIPVEATSNGFYGSIFRKVGARFEIAKESEFSESWMRKLGSGKPARKQAAAQEQDSESSDEVI